MGSCSLCNRSEGLTSHEPVPNPTVVRHRRLSVMSFLENTPSSMPSLLANLPLHLVTGMHTIKCGGDKELVVIEGETEVLMVLETFAGEVLVQYGCVQTMSMLLSRELRMTERQIDFGQTSTTIRELLTAVNQECVQEDLTTLSSTDTLVAFLLRTLHRHP